MSENKQCCKKTSIGGQALIEGVMMRGPKLTCLAVRHIGTGEIITESWETAGDKRPAWTKWPLIRGVFGFADSMIVGYKTMMKSADLSGFTELEEEEEAAKKAAKAAKKAKKAGEPIPEAEEKKQPQKLEGPLMTALMIVSVILGVGLAVLLFMYLPSLLYNHVIKPLAPQVFDNRFMQSLFEGVLRIAIFIGYIVLTSLMKDIRRVYMYHGAEHKTIFCYEKDLPLTVENVRLQRRFHPRCGTSFMILMLIVGVFIGMLIPTGLPSIVRALIKIALLPLSVGIGYEAIKFCGRHDNRLTRIIAAPGTWLQHITTREPDDDMIECAITAFQAVIPENEQDDRW
ncbi:MAG: DUF1385 domain-containing protein [Clostridia bacterium]|nr:DUF1385 domain-containing protein [Clostridia bacterium]